MLLVQTLRSVATGIVAFAVTYLEGWLDFHISASLSSNIARIPYTGKMLCVHGSHVICRLRLRHMSLTALELLFPSFNMCPDSAVVVITCVAKVVYISPIFEEVASAVPKRIVFVTELMIAITVPGIRPKVIGIGGLRIHVDIIVGGEATRRIANIAISRCHTHFAVVLCPQGRIGKSLERFANQLEPLSGLHQSVPILVWMPNLSLLVISLTYFIGRSVDVNA